MISLNLTASGTEQTLIKDYLEQNASEELADKINNGVIIEKDGIKLLNVKTLEGFMAFALEEAKKLAENGARGACIEDKVVFGWAIHYFEEESIEGTLYQEDGTEYKPVPKTKPRKVEPQPVIPRKKPVSNDNGQQSMFDVFDLSEPQSEVEETIEPEVTETIETESEDAEETIEETEPDVEEKTVSPLYTRFKEYQENFGDNTIILMRIGDFYEIFGEWAVKASTHLELTLVGRDFGLQERVPMVGLPYHRLDVYLPKMLEIAHVAIYEKDEPAQFHPMTSSIEYSNVDKRTGELLEAKLRPEQEECLRIIRNLIKEDLEVSL